VESGLVSLRVFDPEDTLGNGRDGSVPPAYLSSDNDPLFEFHRWKANLRILEVEEIEKRPAIMAMWSSSTNPSLRTRTLRVIRNLRSSWC
jgi:hypothetical protein